MIDSNYRQPYQETCVDPVVRGITKWRIHPITITFFACLFGVLTLPLLAFQQSLFALACLLISGYLDTLDGSVARSNQQTSDKGALFDVASDRLVEFAVVFGLYLYDPATRGIHAFLMLGSIFMCVTTFLLVGIFVQQQSHKSFYYSPGLMERAEAFVFFALMILLPSYFISLSLIFSILVFLTALIRVTQFARQN